MALLPVAPERSGAAVEHAVLGIDRFGIGGGAGIGARRVAGDQVVDFEPVLDGADAPFEGRLLLGHDWSPNCGSQRLLSYIIIRLGRFCILCGAGIWHCRAAKSGGIHGVRRRIDRRSFLVGASAAGGGLALGFAVPFAADFLGQRAGARRWRRVRNHLLGRDRARQHGDDPRRPCRNGAGRLDRARHAGGRGTRMRLGDGQHRIRIANGKSAPQPDLGRYLDRAPAARSRRRKAICAAPAPRRAKC